MLVKTLPLLRYSAAKKSVICSWTWRNHGSWLIHQHQIALPSSCHRWSPTWRAVPNQAWTASYNLVPCQHSCSMQFAFLIEGGVPFCLLYIV
jgi:hypothetical protein